MPRGIREMHTQLKLKFNAESFESKPLCGYVLKKFQKIATLIRNLPENGQPARCDCAIIKQEIGTKDLYTDKKNNISNHQQQVASVDYVRKK